MNAYNQVEARRLNRVKSFLTVAAVVSVANALLFIAFEIMVEMDPAEHWTSWLFYRLEITAILNVLLIAMGGYAWGKGPNNARSFAFLVIIVGGWAAVCGVYTAIDTTNCSSVPYCWKDPPGEMEFVVWILLGHSIISFILAVYAFAMLGNMSKLPRTAAGTTYYQPPVIRANLAEDFEQLEGSELDKVVAKMRP